MNVDASRLRPCAASSTALATHCSFQIGNSNCASHGMGSTSPSPHPAPVKPLGLTPLVLASSWLAAGEQHSTAGHGVTQAWIPLPVTIPQVFGTILFYWHLVTTLCLCNALQADLEVHSFINNQSHHIKIQTHLEGKRQLCC